MPLSLLIHGLQITSTAEYYHTTDEGMLLRGRSVSLEPPVPAVSYYLHGWQSWSLTTWLEAGRRLPPSFPQRLRAMQMDPVYANHPRPHSAWVGAVELPDGQVLLLGALSLEAHVEYTDAGMHGWYESGEGEWLAALGTESQVFAAYAAALATRLGVRRDVPAPRVWCSWYSYYAHPDEASLSLDLQGLRDLPFDAFQLDDGWQVGVGDWEPNERFRAGMGAFAGKIRSAGFTPGLWLAPLIALPTSRLFKEHPDWFLRDQQSRLVSAGHGWGNPVYALDATHPAALDWLTALMKKVRGWGYEYVKLDFLYAGALPGRRHEDIPRETGLRLALKTMRESLGDAYLLVCGTPVLPALGLCDGLRIGPDVAGRWVSALESETLYNFAGPGAQNAIRTSLARLWLHPLVHTDPDVAFFRTNNLGLSDGQKHLLQDLALIAGFRGTSDLPRWLTTEERDALREFLEADPVVLRLNRYGYKLDEREVDFAPHINLPPEGVFDAGRFKRFIQRRASSDRLLAWGHRYDRYLQRRRLRRR
jgi:alpha-galactosidase